MSYYQPLGWVPPNERTSANSWVRFLFSHFCLTPRTGHLSSHNNPSKSTHSKLQNRLLSALSPRLVYKNMSSWLSRHAIWCVILNLPFKPADDILQPFQFIEQSAVHRLIKYLNPKLKNTDIPKKLCIAASVDAKVLQLEKITFEIVEVHNFIQYYLF